MSTNVPLTIIGHGSKTLRSIFFLILIRCLIRDFSLAVYSRFGEACVKPVEELALTPVFSCVGEHVLSCIGEPVSFCTGKPVLSCKGEPVLSCVSEPVWLDWVP